MEFNEKLQELRRRRGITQEELAEALLVSRTAVSKWESGRGYPGIDSLKALSKFFGVTVDELLSGDELLTLASEDTRQKEKGFFDLVFGLLDVSAAALLFLPFFGEKVGENIKEVSLLTLSGAATYLKVGFYGVVAFIVLWGILALALQTCQAAGWTKAKRSVSLMLSVVGVLLFIMTRQPYAAVYLLVFLAIKVFLLIKRR